MYLRCKVICPRTELWAASQSRATVITAVSTRTTKSDRNSRPPRSRLCREFEGQQSWRHRLARHPALLAWRRCEPSFSELHWRRSSAPPASWPHASAKRVHPPRRTARFPKPYPGPALSTRAGSASRRCVRASLRRLPIEPGGARTGRSPDRSRNTATLPQRRGKTGPAAGTQWDLNAGWNRTAGDTAADRTDL
jgi:hypothetical protein